MSADFELRADGGGRLYASGQLNIDTASRALGAGLSLLPQGGHCRVDLGEIIDADSAGLAVLIEWLAQARARGTRLEYANLPSTLRSLAKLSGVEFLFPDTIAGQAPL